MNEFIFDKDQNGIVIICMYMDETPISRQLTDAMVSPIFAGSSEIMKVIISRSFITDNFQPFNEINF